jgi:hypothetical protein
LPVTAGAYTTELPTSSAIYVSEIDPTAPASSQLIYSTHFPAASILARLEPPRIALDKNGRIYITVNSTEGFPVTSGAYLRTCSQLTKECTVPGFAVLDPSQSGAAQLVYATFFPGTVQGLAINQTNGQAYLTGTTGSGHPTTSNGYS